MILLAPAEAKDPALEHTSSSTWFVAAFDFCDFHCEAGNERTLPLDITFPIRLDVEPNELARAIHAAITSKLLT